MDKTSASEVGDMSAPLFLDVDGISTRYFEAGSGSPTLVLIHGGDYDYREVASATDWLPNFGPLAKTFHVIAFDKLGCGHTDSPAEERAHTVASVVVHARRFLKLLDVRDVILWGHSRGALAALRLAVDAPELVSGLVITNSNSAAPEDPSIPRSFYTKFYSKAEAVATPATLRQLWNALSYDPANHHVNEVYQRKLTELLTPHSRRPMTTAAIQRMLELKRRYFGAHLIDYKYETLELVRAGRLQASTLVLWGLNDPTVSAWVGFDLYRRLALYTDEVDFHVINRVGHYPQVEDPTSVHRILAAFAGVKCEMSRQGSSS